MVTKKERLFHSMLESRKCPIKRAYKMKIWSSHVFTVLDYCYYLLLYLLLAISGGLRGRQQWAPTTPSVLERPGQHAHSRHPQQGAQEKRRAHRDGAHLLHPGVHHIEKYHKRWQLSASLTLKVIRTIHSWGFTRGVFLTLPFWPQRRGCQIKKTIKL